MRIVFGLLCLSVVLIAGIAKGHAQTHSPLKVVTSFSILEDLVKALGGEQVEITNLVARNSDAHSYQPKPSDAIAIAKADLVVANGLGFEGWITRLMDNNGYKNARLIASQGVHELIQSGEVDPHAWQSFSNITLYIHNISRQLMLLRPQHSREFTDRRDKLLQKLNALRSDLMQQVDAIPSSNRVVVTSHDAFGYLGREFGFTFLAPVGLSTEAEASASDVAQLIDQIHTLGVQALFIENINNPMLLQQISSETGVRIGGRLYSDALSEQDGPASTYLAMMRHNLETLTHALKRP